MKKELLNIVIFCVLFLASQVNFAQAPNLGTAADFVLFSTNGAVTDVAQSSHLTGNVGAQIGAVSGFGNVDGQMHSGDGVTAQCAADLLIAYGSLNTAIPAYFPGPLLGNGVTLVKGVYSITSPSITLNANLNLDAQGDSNAVFIFQLQGTFSTNTASQITLLNGAKACNVFWKVEGLITMAAGTIMKGTLIANNAAISIGTGVKLEGRLLSTAGAIGVNGVLAYTPIGCGSPFLTGPVAPALASTGCYALFSSIGYVTNVGVTHISGDVGSNSASATGFNPLFVNGIIHPVPDGSTAACSADLLNVYNYLNTLPYDIELLYPAQFGNSLVLTPHTYRMNAAATFTDTVFLNAEGNANAVFVFQIGGALSTSTYSVVKLINGAQAKNVFWKVEGAVNINDYSQFAGTIICNGAISLTTGVTLDGRALTTVGALNTSAINVIMPPSDCNVSITQPMNQTVCEGQTAVFSVHALGVGLIYQWRKGNINLINGGNISGATSDSLIIAPANISDTSTAYNVIVSGTYPPADTSINLSLIVNPLPTPSIIVAGGPTNICANDSVLLSGNIGGIWSNDSTTATITVKAPGNYFVINSNNCGRDTSNRINVTVNPLPVAPLITANGPTTFCANDSVTLSGNTTGGTWSTGALTSSIAVKLPGIYFVVQTNSCGTDTSNRIIVTVNPLPVAPLIAANGPTAFCANDSVILSGNVNGGTWNTGALTSSITVKLPGTYFVVQTNICGTDTSNRIIVTVNPLPVAPLIAANGPTAFCANDSVILSGNVNGGTWSTGELTSSITVKLPGTYFVVQTNSCGMDTSNRIIVTVNPLPVAPLIAASGPTAFCANDSVILAGNINGGTWNTGELTSSITVKLPGTYFVVQTNICGTDTSNRIIVTVNPLPVAPRITASGPTAFCANDSLILSGNANGGTWSTGALTSSITVKLPGTYFVVQTNNCGTDTSNRIIVTVNPLPVAPLIAANGPTAFCANDSVTLAGNINGGTWNTGELTSSITVKLPGTYFVVQTNSCGTDTSNRIIVTVNPLPVAPRITASGPTAFCANDSVILSGNVSGGTWNTGALTLSIAVKLPGTYFVVQTNSCGTDTSNRIVITNDTLLNIISSPADQITCAGSSAVFTTTAVGTNLTYQWRKGNTNLTDGGNISGATSSTLTIANVSNADTASDYNVIVAGSCSNIDTSIGVLLALCVVDTFIDCHFPNTITPNNDGVNDVFLIACNDEYPNADVKIYDRWGAEVYRSLGHYDNTWNAQNQQGTKLPDGTYFYIYNFNNGKKKAKQGFIDVYR
jgi:gliding motility-associated-like protein